VTVQLIYILIIRIVFTYAQAQAETATTTLTIQDVIPYVISDFLSWLLPSILSPLCYVLLVYFIAGLRGDDLAANLFTVIASVSTYICLMT
jgi:hypothetical protein